MLKYVQNLQKMYQGEYHCQHTCMSLDIRLYLYTEFEFLCSKL